MSGFASESVAADVRRRFGDPRRSVGGIPSYDDATTAPDVVTSDVVERALEELERRPLREALEATLAGHDGRERFLRRVFRPGAESWRFLVGEQLRGTCLDATAGFGTRALLLAEVDGVDAVYAADGSPEALQFLAARTDFDPPAPVIPLHASVRSLPEPDERFDTVVADVCPRGDWNDARETVRALSRTVADDGTLVAALDGPARLSGLTRRLGIDSPGAQPIHPGLRELPAAVRATPAGYRSLFQRAGFESVRLYALLPSHRDPMYGFALSDPHAVEVLFGTRWADDGRLARLFAWLADRNLLTPLVQRWAPSYLAVCRRDGPAPPATVTLTDDATGRSRSGGPARAAPDDPALRQLVVRGRARSVILEHAAGDVRRVRKVPHRHAHARFVTSEHEVPALLRADADRPGGTGASRSSAPEGRQSGAAVGGERADDAARERRSDAAAEEGRSDATVVRRALPTGTIDTSRFGPVYTESPAHGTKLTAEISRDPADFRRALAVGFDWITALQRQYGGERRTVPASRIRDDLSIHHLDLEPPSVPRSVSLFETPIHGDFQPGNVYVRDGEITRVIDWEYAAPAGNPIVDPAFHAIWVAGTAFDGLYEGLERAFVEDTVYADHVGDVVETYCDAVDLSPRAFLTYFPYAWIRRHQICADLGASMHYTDRGHRRADVIDYVWDHVDEIAATLNVVSDNET